MRSLLIAFIATLGLCYTAAQCPPEELIKPCKCIGSQSSSVSCENINDKGTLVGVLEKSGDRKFTNLAVINSSVTHLPATAISSKGVEELGLFNVSMSALFDALPSDGNVINNIIIRNVRFQRGVGWELFGSLKRLDYFEAVDTEIESLDKSFTENINRRLWNFILRRTKTRKIQHNAFEAVTTLRTLEISNSKIKFVQRSMFPSPATYLKSIDFSGNEIETLPDNLFSNMPDLHVLHFENNKLTTVSREVFSDVHDRLGWICLYGNPFVCDCKMLWFVTLEKNRIVGNCEGPANLKGKNVHDLTRQDLSNC